MTCKLVGIALVVAGCGSARSDRVLETFDSPVPFELREFVVRQPPEPCDEVGWRQVTCPFRARRATRCIYGRLGAARTFPPSTWCYDEIGPERFLVIETTGAPPEKISPRVFIDAEGSRLLIQLKTEERLVVLLESKVLIQTSRPLSADPAAALRNPLATELSDLPWSALGDARGSTANVIRDGGGPPALRRWLEASLSSVGDDVWTAVFESLPPEERAILVTQLADATLGPIDTGSEWQPDPQIANGGMLWFLARPDVRPADFHQRALRQLTRDVLVPTTLLDYLASRGEPAAGEAACALLTESMVPSDEPMLDRSPDVKALYVVAALGTKCPAATDALSALACDDELRCGSEKNAPLCTPAQARTLARENLRSFEPSDGGDSSPFVGRLAPAIAAAAAQGSLPQEFLQREARHRYRLVKRGCSHDDEELLEAVCRAPLDNRTVEEDGYTLKIDDRTRSVVCAPQHEP